jgi:hypothetical protein
MTETNDTGSDVLSVGTAKPKDYVVRGRISWSDGTPVVDVVVRAVDEDLRGEQPLGPYAPKFTTETRTDASGAYEIVYGSAQYLGTEIKSADLVVRALDANGEIVAASPTMFNAGGTAEIDLTLSGAVAGQPSEYERLVALLAPLLEGADPPDVTALKASDLDFLVGETGADRAELTDLLTAVGLYQDAAAAFANSPPKSKRGTAAAITSADLLVPAFYGLLREGLSPDWTTLLQSGQAAIQSALSSAVGDGIIPRGLARSSKRIASQLAGLATAQALGTPTAATPVSALLGAASLSTEQQQTLLTAAATSTGTPQEFWSSLPRQSGFNASSVARLQLTLQLGALTGNNVPVVEALLARASVNSPADLVGMGVDDWTELLSTGANGQMISVPAGVPGTTPAEQVANYAKGLVGTIQSTFPNETVAHLVASSAVAVDQPTKAAIGQFFANAPDFDIRTTRITSYVSANSQKVFARIPAQSQPALVSQLQRLQRALQISVDADSMTNMLALGLDAAHLVAGIPPQSFVDRFGPALGGADVATAIHQRAGFIDARSAGLIAQLNDAAYGLAPAALGGLGLNAGAGPGAAKKQILEQFPDYEELFGALDPCECDDCMSVISPAAYFVDMLQFLDGSTPNDFVPPGSPPPSGPSPLNAHGNTPLDVLIGKKGGLAGRRPDLAYLKLTCENTYTELPYVDLVNEVMESYILYGGPTRFAAHDTGEATSTQLGASPQFTLDSTEYGVAGPPPAGATGPSPNPAPGSTVKDGPYVTLAGACYPFTLPFNEPIAVARTYLNWLGTSRYQVLNTFRTTSAPAAALDAEYLQLDPYLYQVLTGSTVDGQTPTPPTAAGLYGDPPAAPYANWETSVAAVPTFLERTGIETTDLIALLQTRFVNPGYPSGPDRAFFEQLPFDYRTLMALVGANFDPTAAAVHTLDPSVVGDLADAGIAAGDIKQWWQRNPGLGDTLVLYCPDGCDVDEASISRLNGMAAAPPPPPSAGAAPPSPAPPSDTALGLMQAFIRLWRTLGWSMADLDRAFTALQTVPVTSGGNVLIPAAFIHDLSVIAQLQATLDPPALQVLFALWGDLDPNGSDSLYLQLFVNPAALPNDPAFAPGQDGGVLEDGAQTIAGHIPALVAGLQVSAGDLALIQADAGIPDTAPLTLANVTALYRYAALSQGLGLSVADFIVVKALAGGDPFASPDTTIAFVNVARQVLQSNFTATQLAYLYQDVSAPPTGLAPQATTLQLLAQPLRDGLRQIAARCALVPDPKGTLTASTVTQLVSKTVATQTVALVNGTAIYTTPLAALPVPGIAKLDSAGNVVGVDPSLTPAAVGAKLGYDPTRQQLSYQGAMTDLEQTDLLALSADPSWQPAVASLYAQPVDFLTANLAPLLDDPNAPAVLLHDTASLDGSLNPVMVDAVGNVVDADVAASTAIAWKFAYLLTTLLPYLQSTLSRTLVKQTIADTFTLSSTLTSVLVEQVLSDPDSTAIPASPVVEDLLALATAGATVTSYATPDLSGPPVGGPELVASDEFAVALPAGTQSAAFVAWLEVPSSATFTFEVASSGTPKLYVGDALSPAALVPVPSTPGLYRTSNGVALTAGGFTRIGLEIANLPGSGPGTVTLSWQSPSAQGAGQPAPQSGSIPNSAIPGSVLLPDAVYEAVTSAYIRIQKAALLANQFALTAPEIQYLSAAGAQTPAPFGGFDLNGLPLTPGLPVPAATATALFDVWRRLLAYTALRGALPSGSVTLVDLFSAASFGQAAALLPQVTSWSNDVTSGLLAEFFPAASDTDPNPIVDEVTLTAMQACAALVQQVGSSPGQLFSWARYSWPAAPPATPEETSYSGLQTIAAEIRSAAAANYDPQSWAVVAEQLNDTLRASRRDALVSYLMGQLGFADPDSLFELLLIDPEMGTCMQTSRIRQALNSVQLFVQRCLLGLEKNESEPAVSIHPSQIDATTWNTWMNAYSLWAANREVFLWPENWLLPSLRDDQTEIFQAFASSLQQGTITDASVGDSFLAYLQGLEQIDRLDIRCVFWQGADASVPGSVGVLHVFGRTWHDPRVYFYRRRLGNPGATQTWTPWQKVQVDIQGDFLVPVVYEGRLRLIWPVFTQQTYTPPQSSSLTASADSSGSLTADTAPPPQNYWQITLAWSDLYQGAWQPKQVSSSFLTSFWCGDNEEFFHGDAAITGPLQPNVDQHVFKARIDGSDLVVDVYARFGFSVEYASSPAIAALRQAAQENEDVAVQLIADATKKLLKGDVGDAIADQQLSLALMNLASLMLSEANSLITSGIDEGRGPLLLGQFRFRACGDTITVAYTDIGTPDAAEASPDQSSNVVSSARLMATPSTDAYENGARQENHATATALELWTGGLVTLTGGGFGNQPWPFTQSQPPSADKVKYLKASPCPPFELRYSQQGWQFALEEPFFYQDAQRTFCVDPGSGATLKSRWLIDRTSIDPRLLAGITQLRTTPPELSKQIELPSGSAQAGTATALRPAATEAASATNGRSVAEASTSTALVERPSTSLLAPEVAISSGLETAVPYKLLSPTNWGSIVWHGPYMEPDAELRFQTHRHPYVCKLIEKLVAAQGQSQSGGIDGLLKLANQNLSNGFDFVSSYQPVKANVLAPAPTETVDFSPTGAYSGYNWELFFHAPLLVALTLSQNGQYQDADKWFRYIFDPTNPKTSSSSPLPYWQVQPFTTSVPQTLLALMNSIDSGDTDAVAQVDSWYWNPFQPFVIARSRIGAFQKYVFMAYIGNLLAWADQLYGQVDTIESINQATQLYVFVSDLLGELAQEISGASPTVEYDYHSVREKLDAFSNFAETVENAFPFSGPVPSDPQSQVSGLLGLSKSLFFCIPQNQQLLQYWSTVAGRLYNIRHCLNIQGVPQTLALFQPPANPLLLIEAEAEGIDPGSVLADISAPLPNYRFGYLIERATDLASTCQAFGRQLLEALEKNDAEYLSLLRATQETQILNLMTDAKQQAVNEAQANIDALSASRAVEVNRYTYYQLLLTGTAPPTPAVGAPINLADVPSQQSQNTGGVQLVSEEAAELALSGQAAQLHEATGLLQVLASTQSMIPSVSIGVNAEPLGVGGTVSVSFGGSNLAASTEAVVHGLETYANYLTYQAWAAGKMGGYFRRQQEWTLMSNAAALETMRIDQQSAAAKVRLKITQDDLATHQQQIVNAQKVQDYLGSKFTNEQLYQWMIGQVSSVYSQLYQLAYSTAKMAEVAYQRELSVTESSYITFGYWDSLRKGLLAGDRLQLALKQLERAYMDQNEREFEITRHVSLLLHDPGALIALKTTGACTVQLPEALFDTDYPGQYLRRLRDVSLTIPCVAGPYTSINCTLTLVSSKIRFNASTGGGYAEKPVGTDTRFIYNSGSTAAIATSHAQDDSGVFSVNFRDERYLPFETAGAVSTWLISMPPATNAIDFDTVTDVVMKLSYTARYGGDLLRSQAFAAASLPAPAQQTAAPSLGAAPKQTGRDRLFSLRHEFPTDWYVLFNPPSADAQYGQMPVCLTSDRFPYQYRGRNVQVTGLQVFAMSEPGAVPPASLSVFLTNAAPPPGASPPAPPASPGAEVKLTPDTLYGTNTLYGTLMPASPVAVPQVWWLSIASADLSTVADFAEDLFVLVQYRVT